MCVCTQCFLWSFSVRFWKLGVGRWTFEETYWFLGKRQGLAWICAFKNFLLPKCQSTWRNRDCIALFLSPGSFALKFNFKNILAVERFCINWRRHTAEYYSDCIAVLSPVKFEVVHIIRFFVSSWNCDWKPNRLSTGLECFFYLRDLFMLRNALSQPPSLDRQPLHLGLCGRLTDRKTRLCEFVKSRSQLGISRL